MRKATIFFRATGKFGNNDIVKLNHMVVGSIEYKLSKKDKINKWQTTILLGQEAPARFPSKLHAREFVKTRIREIVSQLSK